MPPDRPSLGVDVGLGELREKLATLQHVEFFARGFTAAQVSTSTNADGAGAQFDQAGRGTVEDLASATLNKRPQDGAVGR